MSEKPLRLTDWGIDGTNPQLTLTDHITELLTQLNKYKCVLEV